MRVLDVGGDDAPKGLDLERLLVLGIPPRGHVPRRRRLGDANFLQMDFSLGVQMELVGLK